jgi:hypothetical protein
MQTASTSKIIWVVLGLLVIIGGAYGLTRSYSSEPVETEQASVSPSVMGESESSNSEKAAQVADTSTTKASFFDLLGKAGAQKCAVTQSSTLNKSSGTFYSSNGKGRGDFESTILSGAGKGMVTRSSMIMDGDVVYMWDPATKKGMKIATSDMKNPAPTNGSQAMTNDVAEQFKQSYDYNCESWKADATLFVPPKDVEFMDMAEMMKGMQGMVPQAGAASGATGSAMPQGMDMSAMCAQCDQAGDGREACRSALGCN